MLAAIFAIAYLGSPRHGGRMAHTRVRRLLRRSLDKARYTQFHDLVLPTGGGTARADHIVVSRFGIFVIASERRPGALAGGESQELWQQRRFGRLTRFPNPLYRAKLQMEYLQRILGIPRKYFQLVVAIDGQERISDKLPGRVVTVDRLMPWIRAQTDQLMSSEQADYVVKVINDQALEGRRGISRTAVAQMVLAAAVAVGVFVVYGDELRSLADHFDERVERLAAPERFDAQGQRKSEREIYEESLTCAWSADTGRCACYEPDGDKVEMALDACRALAERGSILKQ